MSGSTDIIVVPDLPTVELLAQAEKRARLTHLNPDLKTWNFCEYRVEKGEPARILEVRGKKYEVLLWRSGYYVVTENVRDHFRALGADGNTAAFIAWISEAELSGGIYASIPSDDALLFRFPDGYLCAPTFSCDGADRRLYLRCVGHVWLYDCAFVAFREIQ
ncbi:MAG: hypothetical protein PHC70_03025 [Patescibacteria group bacterium]|nr:hypothetical protein [Patescibacteria group bacterium]